MRYLWFKKSSLTLCECNPVGLLWTYLSMESCLPVILGVISMGQLYIKQESQEYI